MRQLIDLILEGMDPLVYHSTEYAPEILSDGFIKANSMVSLSAISDPATNQKETEDYVQGICVTRSLYFAKQFSYTIFAIDREKVRNNYRIVPRAERNAYDLANNHGDFRIEAEEFIICMGLSLTDYVTKIWVSEEVKNNPEYTAVINHELFSGFYKQP